MRKLYPVSVSCGVLEVSASGYFNWLRRRESGHGGPARRHSDEALLAYMRAIHAEVKGEAGLGCGGRNLGLMATRCTRGKRALGGEFYGFSCPFQLGLIDQ